MQIRYIVFMGVSGSGKSTLARHVAEALDWPFVEGDDLHPDANIDKMRRGIPLDDADRAPWLAAVAETLRQWRSQGREGVISCSALRRAYRDAITDGCDDVLFVYLHGSRAAIAQRLAGRRGHFMPADLLDGQFEALEAPVVPPERAVCLEIEQPIADQVGEVIGIASGTAPERDPSG